ncbi:MAG: hypothetical protein PQJ28_03965, partial [Spirochaetales bacterium]|nr:hypothetical protein [Spirochaetales bacterium]
MAAVFWLACPNPGHALEYFIDTKADMDALRLVFDQKNLSGKVARTGRQQITISFPKNALKGEKQPTPAPLSSLRIVKSLDVGSSSITIGTRTSAFGFIRMPAGNGQMLIQFFRDPIGSKWRSPKEKARRDAERKKAARKKAAAQKKVAADKKAKAEAARKAAAQKAAAKAESKPPQPPVIDEIDLPDDEESPQLKQELEQAAEDTSVEQVPPQPVKRPFYSVPYTYRAPVAKVGPGQATPVDTSVLPARAGGSARRVSDNGEAGGQVAGRIEPDSSGGSAGGSIVPPPSDEPVDEGFDEAVDEGAAAEDVAYEEEFPEGEGASGSVTPPQQSGGSASGSVSGSIAPPPSQDGGQASGQVSGRIAPPDSSASGQVTPPPQDEDSFEATEFPPLEDEGTVEDVPETGNVTDGRDEAVEGEQDVSDSDAYPVEDSEQLDEGGEEGEAVEGEKELSPEDRIKIAKGVLLAAEGALDEGEIEAAIAGFTEVSLMKELPQDMRLRALYGKAEALTELHRAAMADNFGEIASAWMEAMNADTKSPNVPMALLNLGLLNLKVGNMPEAKAYFNLLKSQYPNDPNIPYISYYWGEYYLGMKEYEKAADQFQYLVQMYPDSKIVRDAALGL